MARRSARINGDAGAEMKDDSAGGTVATYYYHGHYYEVDENTRPEWVDAGRKRARATGPDEEPASKRERTSHSTNAPRTEATHAQVVPQTTLRAMRRLSTPEGSASRAIGFSDLPGSLRERIYRLVIPSGTTVRLDRDGPPRVDCEPALAMVDRTIHDEVLRIFYAENRFESPFHEDIRVWLRELPTFKLRSLRTVRVSWPLSVPAYMEAGLKGFNKRKHDGLDSDVVKWSTHILDGRGKKELVWVCIDDLDQYVGMRGKRQADGSLWDVTARRK